MTEEIIIWCTLTTMMIIMTWVLVYIPSEHMRTTSVNDSAIPGIYGQLLVIPGAHSQYLTDGRLLEIQAQLSPHTTYYDGHQFKSCDECLAPEECPRCYLPSLGSRPHGTV